MERVNEVDLVGRMGSANAVDGTGGPAPDRSTPRVVLGLQPAAMAKIDGTSG